MADAGNGCRTGEDAASVDVSRGSTRAVSASEGAGGAAGGGGASPEGQSEALVALDVSLAHNELRAMLDAIYSEMDALRCQEVMLKEENARLREEAGRRQEELARAADARGNDAVRLERELLDARQQHQALSARHVRRSVCGHGESVCLLIEMLCLTAAERAGRGTRAA